MRQPIIPASEAHTHTIRFAVVENPYGDEPEVAGFFVVDESSRTIEANEGFPMIGCRFDTYEQAARECALMYALEAGERVMKFTADWHGVPAGTPVIYVSSYIDVQENKIIRVRSLDGSRTLPCFNEKFVDTWVESSFLKDL